MIFFSLKRISCSCKAMCPIVYCIPHINSRGLFDFQVWPYCLVNISGNDSLIGAPTRFQSLRREPAKGFADSVCTSPGPRRNGNMSVQNTGHPRYIGWMCFTLLAMNARANLSKALPRCLAAARHAVGWREFMIPWCLLWR